MVAGSDRNDRRPHPAVLFNLFKNYNMMGQRVLFPIEHVYCINLPFVILFMAYGIVSVQQE